MIDRSEARNIPQLLTAKIGHTQHEASGDEYEGYNEGFFEEDEAFVAAPVTIQEEETVTNKIQQAYHEAMLVHFRLARAILDCTPPLDRIQGLHPSIPISFPPSSKSARQTWEKHVAEHYPHPVQIACMDAHSVLELIRLITRRITPLFRSTNEGDVQRTGTWIWALLAKVPERGSLCSDEIADLRAFAKRADTLWELLQKKSVEHRSHDSNNESQGVGEVEDNKSETSLETPENSDEPDGDEQRHGHGIQYASVTEIQNTRSVGGSQLQNQQMILDMVLTIVGEVYGQRDLLELRRPWVTISN